jgi:TPR repeat protein
MSDNIKEDNNNEIHNNIESIDKQNSSDSDNESSVFIYPVNENNPINIVIDKQNPSDSDDESYGFIYSPGTENKPINTVIEDDTNTFTGLFPIFVKYINELLQELYTLLLNLESNDDIDHLYKFINNFLFEYDLDPNNIFKFMIIQPECHSSLIGFFYQHGIGCEIDNNKAFEIFSNSIKRKYESNQEGASDFYYYGNNDTSKLVNNTNELNEIILQYFYIIFLYEDIISYRKKNYKLHIKDAENGDNVSQYYIGNCYRNGSNIKKDYNLAIDWYLKSSEGGNIKAMYELGLCCDHGYGVTKDEKKAFDLYLKSAEGGYKHAIKNVGLRYSNGHGTLKDENKAFEWHLRAAKKGHGVSQYFVANHYFYYDEEKGFYWIRKAAINGNVDAQFELAEYYLNNSINKDEKKAFKWYLKLANDHEHRAIYSVAKCYRDGIGIDKNTEESSAWFRKYIGEKDSFALNDFLNGTGCYSL